MTEAAETPDAIPATGANADLSKLLAEVQAGATTPVALVKMQMALSDMEALNTLAADEATVAQAEELAKAWIEGDDPLRKAFASHWVARARGAVKGANAAADRFGERMGRRGADLYAGTKGGKRKIKEAAGLARVRGELDQIDRLMPRGKTKSSGPGPRGFLPEGTKVTPASSGPGFRGFLPEGSTIKLRPGQQTQEQFEAKRADLTRKSIRDAGQAAGRQAESGLRERFRQKGAKIGRNAVRGAAFAGGAAAGAGAAYAGSRRWDSSKHNRGDGGKFSR